MLALIFNNNIVCNFCRYNYLNPFFQDSWPRFDGIARIDRCMTLRTASLMSLYHCAWVTVCPRINTEISVCWRNACSHVCLFDCACAYVLGSKKTVLIVVARRPYRSGTLAVRVGFVSISWVYDVHIFIVQSCTRNGADIMLQLMCDAGGIIARAACGNNTPVSLLLEWLLSGCACACRQASKPAGRHMAMYSYGRSPN